MNLASLYSLTSGQKIKNIDIIEKYYPLNLEKYLLFHPFSKSSKSYGFWQDVLEILYPILKDAGYSIVQVGLQSDPLLSGCIDLRGKTTINQCAYLCSQASLGLLCDSFISHLAGHYDIPRVILVSNNYKECVEPYFGGKDKQIILEPDRTKRKPSFQLDESQNKQINEIRPEKIAESACQLLGLPFNFEYETVYVGEQYQNKMLETVPTSITNVANLGTDSVIIRMDYEFNETILQHQMQHCPVIIVTDKPINLEILKNFKPRIKQLIYLITKEHNPNFASAVQKLSIPFQMFSYLPNEELNKFKLDYLDIATIHPKNAKTKSEIKEIKDIPPDQLYYKSCKHTLSNGKIYSSKAGWLKNQPVTTINQIMPVAPIDSPEWELEMEYFMVLRKKN